MARLHFRLTSVTLDEEEDPKEVTAIVDKEAFQVIASVLGHVHTIRTSRGGTEMTVALPVDEASKLFRECGGMSGLDPRHDTGGSEIYDSLTMVFYGIMQE